MVSTLGHFSVLNRLYSKSLILNPLTHKRAEGIYKGNIPVRYHFSIPSPSKKVLHLVALHDESLWYHTPAVERKHDPLEEGIQIFLLEIIMFLVGFK